MELTSVEQNSFNSVRPFPAEKWIPS